jgi:dihydrofolate reductase
MGRLVVFNQVSLDGFICDVNGDMSWAHRDDPEWNQFVAGNASTGGLLVLGRVTYELMASFWPTPAAIEQMPDVAGRMNAMPKIVFSRQLQEATWNNTRLVKSDVAGEMRKMKKRSEPDMAILGSSSIVSQLAQERLIDEFQIAVIPVVLGQGKTMFTGIKERLTLKLKLTRTFANGNVLLLYEPLA